MAAMSDFGKEIKKRLIDLGETQEWLIEQVRERTGDYFDGSYLWRIMVGRIPADRGNFGKPGKADVIREILEIPEQVQHTTEQVR